jgi:hypothetical protein
MKSLKYAAIIFISVPFILNAQPLLIHDDPEDENVRLAWSLDADGGVDNGRYEGFEVAYASKIYPLDQMVISYGYSHPDGNSMHSVLLSVEEYYPVAETFKLYGVAGLGYLWTDFASGVSGDSTGWFGKLGVGGVLDLNDSFDLYAEISFQASDRDLWLDGSNAVDSTNANALLGFRFKY